MQTLSFVSFNLRVEPFLSLLSGHALDGLLRERRSFAAELIEEELAALGLVEGFFVAGRIAEGAKGALGDQLGSFGIILNLADNLLHNDVFLSKAPGKRAVV